MPKTRIQKEETVVKLTEKFAKAKSVVFADYQGLTMSQLSDLRNKLRDQQAEFTITKNTLLSRALPASNVELPASSLNGPTATLFSFDDEISPIKTLVKSLKEAGKGKVKAGFLGEEYLSFDKIIQLSSLPSKDELRAKTVGVLVAPLQGIVGVLQANLRNLVYALSEITRLSEQKSKGGV